MDGISEALLRLSAASLGLYAGANLTEGFVLVRYWRSLAPAEFFAWYAANDRRLLDFFRPLTAASVLIAILAAAVSALAGHPGRWPAAVAAALALVTLSMFFVYFRDANARFSAASVAAQELPAELARWAGWHWTRTGLSVAALAAGMLALA
jgi:hypothetical protein